MAYSLSVNRLKLGRPKPVLNYTLNLFSETEIGRIFQQNLQRTIHLQRDWR